MRHGETVDGAYQEPTSMFDETLRVEETKTMETDYIDSSGLGQRGIHPRSTSRSRDDEYVVFIILSYSVKVLVGLCLAVELALKLVVSLSIK